MAVCYAVEKRSFVQSLVIAIICFGIERYLKVLTTAKVRAILVSLIKSIEYTMADKYKLS